jgi:hypothetical protein
MGHSFQWCHHDRARHHVVATHLASSSMTQKSNNRLEFALARPTSKGDAPLLAAQPES